MIRQQFLTGTPVKQLLKIIWGHHIEFRQWRNVRRLFLVGIMASYYSLLDYLRYRHLISKTEIELPPIFLLGHWRSGTTFLQTLLSQDKNITTPTFFQCTFPQGFLSVGSRVKQELKKNIPAQRLFDSMSFDIDSPFDDEMATLKITGESMMLDFVFPDADVDRQPIFFCSPKWPKAMQHFAKKITFATGKRLLFKSPVHGYRVDEIKKLFPEAKFIVLTRNPRDVYLSSKHQMNKLLENNALHDSCYDMESYITKRYQSMLTSFEDAVKSLDQNQFTVISYEQLVSDTLGTAECIYKHLDIEGWEESRTAIASWVERQEEYTPNTYSESEEVPQEWLSWSIDYQLNKSESCNQASLLHAR